MNPTNAPLKGIVHGKTIELDSQPGWPDGQVVMVFVRPILPAGEGIRQSAGGWADASHELDSWLDDVQRERGQSRQA